jgi:lipopolysaccharide/colanic/teichoic acid biosynthesis glycosyltransferase
MKRILDIVFSCIILLFFLPIGILISLFIFVESKGGVFYRQQRVGRFGKEFRIYKFRTMHPYSEYLHDYVLRNNGYAQSGKPADDFRITPWGKFLRKYWLDELPQLVNVLRGEMKIVGTRPVSARYFQDIPEDLQKLRNTQKPGCIPPYVALNMKSDVESVQQSERIYLIEKLQRPYSTDTRYFFRAIYNILIRRKRSA